MSPKAKALPVTHAEAATLFHALSDPTRLAILRTIGDAECCVADLETALGAAQSRVSFHLRVLREAGVVADRREGRQVFYRLLPEACACAQAVTAALMPPSRTRSVERPGTLPAMVQLQKRSSPAM